MSNQDTNAIVMNADTEAMAPLTRSVEDEREHRKRQLTAAFRLFGKFGFDEGVAGHITVRDPEHTDHFWVNPMGVSFKQIKQSQLLLVNHKGEVVEGHGLLNGAAFTIHSHVHAARPDVVAAAHAHSIHGKAWASLGRLLDPITQDACAFFEDHALYDDFGGVALEMEEGERIAKALGAKKAAILQNHGLITVGQSVESAAWWYITLERTCQAQLLAEAAGKPKSIAPDVARKTYETVGSELAGLFQFSPLFNVITAEQPDMFE
ncbi:class II aldolase/adducin family protein [Simiduia sp. 21SJ11W-1]|uniref:class II aldolase/adducin family protein n=1 Tax=Simiduia sp. 21SJ11W-1 TaxID=2909669 RepID=UPI00209F5206|nr:class II aldolase/adducin family protein [Simiduia sp. 21SJ11W-1]UTA47670.1 class II aldolase/adducin family protein [Simiduia sp. 21SJ11W-1]